MEQILARVPAADPAPYDRPDDPEPYDRAVHDPRYAEPKRR